MKQCVGASFEFLRQIAVPASHVLPERLLSEKQQFTLQPG